MIRLAPLLVAAQTIPILPSADFDATVEFWSRFGFAETGRWPGDYLILRATSPAIELHFWSNPSVERFTNDVACYVRFDTPDEARACHAAWAAADVPAPARMSEPVEESWGAVEFHVIDVHGNLVRLGGFPR